MEQAVTGPNSELSSANAFEFIAGASAKLASTLDLPETLENVADAMLSRICDFCILYLVEEGQPTVRRVLARHRDSAKQKVLDRAMALPTTEVTPAVMDVLETRKSMSIYPLLPEHLTANNAELQAIAQELNPICYLIAPMVTGGRAVGALLAARVQESRSFSDAEVAVIEELGRRAATAIDHAKVHHRLRQMEGRYTRLLDSNLLGVSLNKFDGTVIDANDRFLEMLGRTREELRAGFINVRQLTPGEYKAMSEEALASLVATGKTTPFEKEYERADGSRIRVMVIAASLSHDVADLLSITVDMTERQKQEETQRYLSEASKILGSSVDYQTTLHNLAGLLVPELAEWCVIHVVEDGVSTPVVVHHEDPAMVNWAKQIQSKYPVDMESKTGLGAVISTGKSEFYPDLSPETVEAAARDEEHLEAIRRVRIGSVMMVPLTARDESVGALVLISPTRGRYTELDLALVEELGRRAGMAVDHAKLFQRVGHEIEERTEELQAVNKELESFAYSVSHDLRAPLRSIMSSSMILLEDYEGKIDQEGQAELKRAANAAKRMSKLIDDLLQYSRLGRREMSVQQVDLSALARMAYKEVGIPDEAVRVEPGLTVTADPDLLRVLLTNLLENAWKFTKEKPEPRIEVNHSDGSFVVKDNGVGFDEQFSEKLFVPFERLHSPQDYPGTGIGLANVKRIVSRHGGKVWAHGKVGEGAEFHFTLGNAIP